MKRFTGSCILARVFTTSEHPCKPRKQMVTSCRDVETVENERQRTFRLANPQLKDFANHASTSGVGYYANGVGDSSVGDGDIRSNGTADSLAKTPRVVKPDIPQDNNKPGHNEYNVQKARLHANLWQQEIKKHLGESTSDANSELRENAGLDSNKSLPDDWESVDPSEGHFYEESPAREEAMMLEEFQKRRERNRIQIASFVKQHLYGRRRPVDGWKYIINNFGKDDKGTSSSALHGEGQKAGNELEKLALKKESGRLSRKA